MTTIGRAAEFAARLEAHLARLTRGSGALAAPPAPATGAAGTAPGVVTLAARVAALEPSAPRRRERALALFVESLLVEEFGPRLADDPALAALVGRVSAQLRADARLAPLVDEAIDRLLQGHG